MTLATDRPYVADAGSNRRWKPQILADASHTDPRLPASISGSTSAGPAKNFCEQAQRKLDEARNLVEQTERPHVPDWDEWEPPEYVGAFKAGEIVGYHCRYGEIERIQKLLDEGRS